MIYLIECRKCHKQYIGATQKPHHIRLNGHRNDTTHRQTEKPVAGHFNSHGCRRIQEQCCICRLSVVGILVTGFRYRKRLIAVAIDRVRES